MYDTLDMFNSQLKTAKSPLGDSLRRTKFPITGIRGFFCLNCNGQNKEFFAQTESFHFFGEKSSIPVNEFFDLIPNIRVIRG